MVKRPRPVLLQKIVQVRLPDELLARIDAGARAAGRTRSDEIRRLVQLALGSREHSNG